MTQRKLSNTSTRDIYVGVDLTDRTKTSVDENTTNIQRQKHTKNNQECTPVRVYVCACARNQGVVMGFDNTGQHSTFVYGESYTPQQAVQSDYNTDQTKPKLLHS